VTSAKHNAKEKNGTRLKYTLKMDTLFKLMFRKYQHLLKRLVADFLDIRFEDITEFIVTNPEITPEELGKKFCRLDINMVVNGQKVDLEVQVADEGNYPERSLFYWAKEFSTGISEGQDYKLLPRTIVISILGFNQFPDPDKFYHEFQCLEVTTHQPLTDKMVLQFYELNKLPPLDDSVGNGKNLWLQLFNAETEEELAEIEKLGVSVMNEALQAYRHVSASDEFIVMERMRSKARHDEAQALGHARQQEREERDAHWQGVVAGVVAEKDAQIADLEAQLSKK